MVSLEIRAQKGKEISEMQDSINRLDETTYKVKSQSMNMYYEVVSTERGWSCQCADHRFRGVKCKHIWAVEFSFAIRRLVQKETVIPELTTQNCRFCGSSQIIKKSIRHNKYGDLQRYLCKECGKTFSFNVGLEKMHASPQMITSAMQLYFSGESLRNTQKFLILQGVQISHVGILGWIQKYISLMQKYVDKIQPQVGNAWRTDELYLKVKGDMKYLFAIMDDETRFWISQQISDRKGTSDVRPLFRDARTRTGKKPRVLISDGAQNFHEAYVKEFYTLANPKNTHIKEITLKGSIHNNKMERMNGEVRDREKVMRGLKRSDTPVLKGYQIFHNFVRTHEALGNRTPAEVAGIKVEGSNKWMTLIQNASLE